MASGVPAGVSGGLLAAWWRRGLEAGEIRRALRWALGWVGGGCWSHDGCETRV